MTKKREINKDLGERPPKNEKGRKSAVLSEREISFVKLYLESGNATDSAQNAGYGSTRKSAAVTGHRLLKSPKIQEAINREFSNSGISDAILYRTLLEGLSAYKITIKRVKTSDGKVKFRRLKTTDFSARFRYLEMAFKLKGYLNNPPGKRGDFNKFVQEAEYIANKKENYL